MGVSYNQVPEKGRVLEKGLSESSPLRVANGKSFEAFLRSLETQVKPSSGYFCYPYSKFHCKTMVSLEDYKKSLGKSAENFSEDEIVEMKALSGQLASALFAAWRKNLVANSVDISNDVIKE